MLSEHPELASIVESSIGTVFEKPENYVMIDCKPNYVYIYHQSFVRMF